MSDSAIQSCDDIKAKVAENPEDEQTRSLLVKRAIDLGCVEHIPDDWTFEVEDSNGDGTEQ